MADDTVTDEQHEPTQVVNIPGSNECEDFQDKDAEELSVPERYASQEQDERESASTDLLATQPTDQTSPRDALVSKNDSLLQKRPKDPENSFTSASKQSRVELSVEPSESSESSEDDNDAASCSAVSESYVEAPIQAKQRGRKAKPKFLLSEYLPAKVAESSRNKPDELISTLVPILREKMKSLTLKPELSLIDLRLPDNYSNELGNNSYLLKQILTCSTEELVKQGVKKVDKVLFAVVDISNLADILSHSLSQGISIDCIEVPIRASSIDSIAACVPNAVGAIILFNAPKICFTDPLNTFGNLRNELGKARWKTLQEETSEKCSSTMEKPPLVKIFKLKLSGPSKKGASKSKETSQKKKRSPKKKKLGMKKRSLDTLEKNSDIKSFTNDGFPLVLQEVNYKFTAYEYWNLKSIHESCKGEGTVVAILDTGLDDSHIAFRSAGKVLNKAPDYTDTDGHGTMCASIVCGNSFTASENPSVSGSKEVLVSSGVAPDTKLLVYKVKRDGDNEYSDLAVIDALVDIKNRNSDPSSEIRVDVVSMSFGSPYYSEPIAKAISDLICAGVIIVCAACNTGHQLQTPICYPARLGNVLCIGSHNMHGKSSPFSPVGQHLDFLAPGENILGAANNLKYADQATCANGTSYAAPAVAGLICLILQCLKKKCDPALAERFHNHWVMKELLREISTNGGTHSNDRGFGTLQPSRFFRKPEHVIENVYMNLTKMN